MRIFKGILLSLTFCVGLGAFVSGGIRILFAAFATTNLLLQLLTCIGLYTCIVVCVKRSQKKMKAHRNYGSKM